ncbi:ADP-ribosylation factor GTPase-activating protein AGD3-like [Hibiscus syriacus]|uniref:ADP-ribosylation factor GTPase-activating protein AGD3-like n=1 Tax=Hibiscus syriacus TaxID=106335 RepID=A0A6A3CBP1_HIBSY|nr:ADP-ribosylation factor GTPase-activating protein AGD3-like [Hibiscus syriacus]
MVEWFFLTKPWDSHLQVADSITLLSGPPSCGKTSLLFQFAINSVSRCRSGNSKVGIDPDSEIFQRIKMKYIDDDDDEGIKKYFAAFHLNDTSPVAVIVDDFGDFFDERSCQERHGNPRGRDLALVRTLALCHNAIIHANKKGPCKLVLSDTHHGDSPRSLFIYKRWIPSIFTIKGDGSGSFHLKYNNYWETVALRAQE